MELKTKVKRKIIAFITAIMMIISIFASTAIALADGSVRVSTETSTVTYLPQRFGAFPVQIHEVPTGSRVPQFIGEPIGQTGWLFKGWAPYTDDYVYEDTVFKALWIRNPDAWFTVRYESGTQGTFAPQVFEYRLIDTETPEFYGTPTGNPGWEFTGWSPELTDSVTSDVTYVAQWERKDGYWFDVTFDSGEYSNDVNITHEHVLIDTPTVDLDPPTFSGNSGWQFVGWESALAESVTEDVTYVAQWERTDSDWFTVTFESGEHSADTDIVHAYTLVDTATAILEPTFTGNSGWVFYGWDSVLADTVTRSVTYTAQWVRQYDYWFTVVYDPGEQGTFARETHYYIPRDSEAPGLSEPIVQGNPGWMFTGWTPQVAQSVTENALHVAQWARIPSMWGKITFESGNQSADDDVVYEHVLIGDLTPEAPDFAGNPGWEFVGWQTTITEYVEGDATYVAQWRRIDGEWFTVTYNPGVFGTFPTQTYEYVLSGSFTPVFSGQPTGQAGWVFDRWAPEWNLTATGNEEYVALWTRQDDYWFTVTFDTGTQSDYANVVHSYLLLGTETPEAPELTSSAYWTFTGWSPEIASTVTENVIYVAQWEEIIVEPEPEPEYESVDAYYYILEDDEYEDDADNGDSNEDNGDNDETPDERPRRLPQTGIESFILLWSALFTLALLVGTSTAVKIRNKKRNQFLRSTKEN